MGPRGRACAARGSGSRGVRHWSKWPKGAREGTRRCESEHPRCVSVVVRVLVVVRVSVSPDAKSVTAGSSAVAAVAAHPGGPGRLEGCGVRQDTRVAKTKSRASSKTRKRDARRVVARRDVQKTRVSPSVTARGVSKDARLGSKDDSDPLTRIRWPAVVAPELVLVLGPTFART